MIHADQRFASSPASHALAAASIASIPTRRVGLMTGANSGEYLDGSSFKRPAFSACAYIGRSVWPSAGVAYRTEQFAPCSHRLSAALSNPARSGWL
jgi:hypothetical protein